MFKNKYKYEVRNKIEWLPIGHGGELTNIAPYFLPQGPQIQFQKRKSESGPRSKNSKHREDKEITTICFLTTCSHEVIYSYQFMFYIRRILSIKT